MHTDNQAAVAIIRRGHTQDPLVCDSLCRIFRASAIYNFRLEAMYIPGRHNVVADRVSRLYEAGSLETLLPYTCIPQHDPIMCFPPPTRFPGLAAAGLEAANIPPMHPLCSRPERRNDHDARRFAQIGLPPISGHPLPTAPSRYHLYAAVSHQLL